MAYNFRAADAHSKEVKAIPLLSKEEESDLGYLSLSGDLEARNKLVEHNIRLVHYIANQFKTVPGQEYEDKVAEGFTGLIRAAEKFDPSKGFKFSTYAGYWIRQAIGRGRWKYPMMIIPHHKSDLVSKIWRAKNQLENEGTDSPTDKQIAERGYSFVNKESKQGKLIQLSHFYCVIDVMRAATYVSLDTPINNGAGDVGTIGDYIFELTDGVADEERSIPVELQVVEEEQESTVWKVIAEASYLTDRELDIITLRYELDGGEPLTLREVGAHFKLSRERIRQIEVAALKKMKRAADRMGISLTDCI